MNRWPIKVNQSGLMDTDEVCTIWQIEVNQSNIVDNYEVWTRLPTQVKQLNLAWLLAFRLPKLIRNLSSNHI
jgi:hypothetical protein